MKVTIRTAILLMILMPAVTVLAATRYGDATIEKGKMTVLSEGKRHRLKADGTSTEIFIGDTIRVGRNSRVILVTNNKKATVTLGSRAVMQAQPWKSKSQKGTFRMLFGRMRSTIVGLSGGERFNVKTATATIGVKGSGFDNTVNSQGITVTTCTDHECFVAGIDGIEKLVPEGFVVVALVTGTTPAVPDPGLDTELDADPDEAGSEVVEAGIVTQEELNESNETEVELDAEITTTSDEDESVTEEEAAAEEEAEEIIVNEPTFNLDDAVQAGASTTIDLNVQFEN